MNEKITAKSTANESLEFLDDNIIQHYKNGFLLLDKGNFSDALQLFDMAATVEPNLDGIQLARAFCLCELGRYEEAEIAAKREPLERKNKTVVKVILKEIEHQFINKRIEDFYDCINLDSLSFKTNQLSLKSAVIYLTELCNSRCITCNAWKNKNENQLDTNTWINLISQIRNIGISSIVFVGGEPLLRKDLPTLVREAKNMGFETILVSTNALMLSESHLNQLIEAGVNSFHVSLDGMGDTYKIIRGLDAFEKVVDALRLISERKINLLILTTLVRQNISELEQIVNLTHNLNAAWFPNLLENRKYLFKGVDMETTQICNPDEIEKTITQLEHLKQKYPSTVILQEEDIKYINDYLEDPQRESKIPCTLGFESIYLDPKANLYSACMSLKAVGNLSKDNIGSLINSTTIFEKLKLMLKRKCKGCTCDYSQRAKFYSKNFSGKSLVNRLFPQLK